MKFLPLIWKNVWRRKFRTTFTLLSIFIAFLLFGILMTIRNSFAFGVEIAGLDRLVLINKVSLIMPLPFSYQGAAADGAGRASSPRTRPGSTASTRTRRTSSRTSPSIRSRSCKVYPEYSLPPEQIEAWLADRQGVIVGKDLAERFGWKIGDRVPLQGTIYLPKTGDCLGVQHRRHLRRPAGVDKTQFFFRYDYLDENRTLGSGQVGWYVVKIADGSRAVEMSRTFDGMFENSSAETKTTTEKGFVEGFAKQIGDIGTIMVAISSIVLFMFGLVAASTMAQSVRERTSELAVLKTLGFSGAGILALVLAESLFIACLGGGVGLGLAWLIVQRGDPTGGLLAIFVLPPRDLWIGVGLITGMGVVAGAMPAVAAMQLKITDALRRN